MFEKTWASNGNLTKLDFNRKEKRKWKSWDGNLKKKKKTLNRPVDVKAKFVEHNYDGEVWAQTIVLF